MLNPRPDYRLSPRRLISEPLDPIQSIACRLDDAFRLAARSGDYRKPELLAVMTEYVAAATRIANHVTATIAIRLGAYARLSAAIEGASVTRAESETQALLECCAVPGRMDEERYTRGAVAWRREADVPSPDDNDSS